MMGAGKSERVVEACAEPVLFANLDDTAWLEAFGQDRGVDIHSRSRHTERDDGHAADDH
jgi:hypothetical protein